MLTVRLTFSILLCPLFPKIVRRMEKMLIPRRAGSAPGLQKRAGDPERGLLQCGYLEYARKRKVTIWPRVQMLSGLTVIVTVSPLLAYFGLIVTVPFSLLLGAETG